MVDQGASERPKQPPLTVQLGTGSKEVYDEDVIGSRVLEDLAQELKRGGNEQNVFRANDELQFKPEHQRTINILLQILRPEGKIQTNQEITNTGQLAAEMRNETTQKDPRTVQEFQQIRNPGFYRIEDNGQPLYVIALETSFAGINNQMLLLTSRNEGHLSGRGGEDLAFCPMILHLNNFA